MGRKRHADKTAEIDQILAELKTGDDSMIENKDKKDAALESKAAKGIGPKTSRKKKGQKIRSKKYTQAARRLDLKKSYPLPEALAICRKIAYTAFDSSLELHLNLDLDIGDDDQKIRTTLTLPHGRGKEVKVLAFVDGPKSKACSQAGADAIGSEETIEEIASGQALNFDKIVSTPDFMPKLAKIAKILGPKGLMPSPKTGTVTLEPEKAITELKKGKLEIKTEPQAAIIHLSFGKTSFPDDHLQENFETVIRAVKEARPAKVKPDFLKSATIAPTMGPGVKVDLAPYR